MKLSVSLQSQDVEFLDSYTKDHGMPSRSATLQKAVLLLRASELGSAYAGAWQEWEDSGQSESWEAVIDDGLGI